MFDIIKDILGAAARVVHGYNEFLWLGLATRLATKKPLRGVVYGDNNLPSMSDDQCVVGFEFAYADHKRLIVPKTIGRGEVADSQLRAELRRLRRAASVLDIRIRAIAIGNDMLEDWK